MEIIATETSGFDLHEADEWIPGQINAIEETDHEKYGAGLKWLIQLEGEEWDTWAFCSQLLNPKTKLYTWLKGLGAQIPEPGDVIELEPFVGRRVEVMFEQETKEGQTREKIVKIRAEKNGQAPIKGQQKRAAAAKGVPVSDGPDDSPF